MHLVTGNAVSRSSSHQLRRLPSSHWPEETLDVWLYDAHLDGSDYFILLDPSVGIPKPPEPRKQRHGHSHRYRHYRNIYYRAERPRSWSQYSDYDRLQRKEHREKDAERDKDALDHFQFKKEITLSSDSEEMSDSSGE